MDRHNGHAYANVLCMSVRLEALWAYGWVIWVLGFYFGEAINPIHVEYYLFGKIWSSKTLIYLYSLVSMYSHGTSKDGMVGMCLSLA